MLTSGQELQFVRLCNDNTQLEMKVSCGEGMLGSRVGRCSQTACIKADGMVHVYLDVCSECSPDLCGILGMV